MNDIWDAYKIAVQDRLKDKFLYLLVGLTFVIAVVNILTKLSDAESYGGTMAAAEPIITEFSSALAITVLLPFLFAFFDRLTIARENWKQLLLPYVAASIIFSALHVALMVLMRKLAWPPLMDGGYVFFHGGFSEAIYEYRKDLISFVLYLVIGELQRQLRTAREEKPKRTDPITLKSGATTIILHPAQFMYAKSAGNYAEVTTLSGTQLARTTLADLENTLREKGCDAVRIHRSYIVNRAAIMETSPIAGGDLTIKLRGGDTLRASRRYKENLLA